MLSTPPPPPSFVPPRPPPPLPPVVCVVDTTYIRTFVLLPRVADSPFVHLRLLFTACVDQGHMNFNTSMEILAMTRKDLCALVKTTGTF